jgi:hypothetical protein
MENSNICTFCNEFTFDQQNEHNIKVHQIACQKKQNKLKAKTQPKVIHIPTNNSILTFLSKFGNKLKEKSNLNFFYFI